MIFKIRQRFRKSATTSTVNDNSIQKLLFLVAMNVENRQVLTDQSQKSRNKKLMEIMDNRTLFIEKIDSAKADFAKAKPFEENCEKAVLDGNDITCPELLNPLRPNIIQAFLTTSRNSITTMLKRGLKTIYV